MFDPSTVVIEAFLDEIADHYINVYGNNEADLHLLISSARNALEIISNSDAPYHDAEHTMMVTLVGQQIIRGRLLTEALTPKDWLHYKGLYLSGDRKVLSYTVGTTRVLESPDFQQIDGKPVFDANADEALADLRAMRAWIAAEREGSTPYDIVVDGTDIAQLSERAH